MSKRKITTYAFRECMEILSKTGKKFFSFVIIIYQTSLSPFLGKNCKHYPSCSLYSQQSIEKYGVLKGIVLSIARIIRCNPWSLGGFDPVPDHVSFRYLSSFKFLGNYQTKLYQSHE